MKQVLVIILVVFTFASCLKVIATHTQVMDTYKNKEAVVARFGQPTEKSQHDSMEEWIYNFGKINNEITAEGKIANANVSSADSSVYKNGNDFSVKPASDKYRKYVKFIFDSSGEVKKWDSKRVNYTKTGPNKKATIWFISITVAVVALIIYGLSNLAVVQ